MKVPNVLQKLDGRKHDNINYLCSRRRFGSGKVSHIAARILLTLEPRSIPDNILIKHSDITTMSPLDCKDVIRVSLIIVSIIISPC